MMIIPMYDNSTKTKENEGFFLLFLDHLYSNFILKGGISSFLLEKVP